MENLDALKVAEDKKKYIIELLNPVLEAMVAECIHKMPEDPVPFMLRWLEDKRIAEEEKALSVEEKDQLSKENADLEENIKKVKSKVNDAAKLVADEEEKAKEAEEEEEEEDDEEPPPDFFKTEAQLNKTRTSVSAEAYGEWNQKKTFVAPVIAKTEEQKDRLRKVLSKSFMFSNLDDQDLTTVIGAMKEVNVSPEQVMITQGEPGDYLFVIESGKLDCLIEDKVVKTCVSGDVFGELALLYNCPRAATVKSLEACVLWQLDRDTFTNLVRDAAQKKRDRYDNFLQKVPLLQSMEKYERAQLADALKVEAFAEGATIVTAGDVGNKFYIIEEGSAVAEKSGATVMSYGIGDYFGELALIRNQPRAATVMAKTAVKVLSLDQGSFKRLLNVHDLLERSAKYT
mmetsp:Transcript_43573/g.79348  ORF Transcript_43573/g.79348 Transcript_43573/m.79348 type:complete len:401 (+) Transcript_43573:72-1274(+)